ncbi:MULTISPECIES: hypothetical protein [unclassified Paenibacillus]|uniref:hypothetical protein n=1 Tax=unclassified Paenibacillus TaxID=185978 RepID=UPI0007BF175B|nr:MULTISPECIES: hypothetical protein [unclassified Paenibacillus]PIH59111.1 hypothetical protein CS562_14320 [Paenibacillus sp. LK1]
MKNDLIYALMSLLDGITIFMFAFGCFKVSFRDYWKEILVTNVVISIGTFYMKSNEAISSFIPIICFLLLAISLTFYFRIRPWSSVKLAIYGFGAQFVSQMIIAILIMVASGSGYTYTLENFGMYIQLIGDGFLIALTLILQKRRIWYTTLPYDYTFKIKLNKTNIISCTLGLLAVVILYNVKQIENVYLGLLFWLICLINIIFIDVVKEKSELA